MDVGLINPPYSQKDYVELEFVEKLLEFLIPRGLGIAVVPMSCAIGTKFRDVRERLFKKHTLKAVFSMPDDIFYPTGTNVCVMVWEAHQPHDSKQKTFFGYYKNDGFEKRKKLGRIDVNNTWEDIKEKWLNLYFNKEIIIGLSCMKEVTHKDEWLCEAYLETDYSQLTQENFEQTIKDYLAYLIKNGELNEIK
ncbi:MAG: N-6 DNA methylase [Fusobacterium gastrosuis]|uniref:N-6 DNA methylase n=1 Tax=Fusobacterium gastrosuis TaxID=1755100 RepID=UPI002A962F0D|nr:N-6 DNA methylase [Fusobacterium gastrosuis]